MKELHGYYLEDLAPGMTALYAKTVTDADVVLFAGISGDVNPVHLNQEFADRTMFRGRIAHGMLTASFISTVIGTKLPGPGCIYVSQNLKFKAPVRVNVTRRGSPGAIDPSRMPSSTTRRIVISVSRFSARNRFRLSLESSWSAVRVTHIPKSLVMTMA